MSTPVLVQVSPVQSTSSPGTTASWTWATAPTPGNKIIVIGVANSYPAVGTPALSTSDNASTPNSYSNIVSVGSGGTGFQSLVLSVGTVSLVPTSTTVTMNGSDYSSMVFMEWSNIGAYDVSAVAGNGATSPNANSFPVGPTAGLANASSIAFSAIALNGSGTNLGFAVPTGMTSLGIQQDNSSFVALGTAYQILSSNAALTPSWTVGTGTTQYPNTDWQEFVVVFQQSGSPLSITTTPIGQTTASVADTPTLGPISATGGSPSYTYQWYWIDANNITPTLISGATSSSYTLPSIASGDNGKYYQCVVTDSASNTANIIFSQLFVRNVKNAYGPKIRSAWAFRREYQRNSNGFGLMRKNQYFSDLDSTEATIWDDWWFVAAAGVHFVTANASLTNTLTQIKSPSKIISTSKTNVVSFIRSVSKNINATTTETVTSVKSATKSFAASISESGTATMARGLVRSISATLSETATIARSVGKLFTIAKTNTPSATTSRSLQRTISASVSETVTNIKSVSKNTVATIASSVSFIRQIGKNAAASIANSPTAASVKLIARAFSATVSSTPSILRSVGRNINSSVASAGSFIRQISKSITGSEQIQIAAPTTTSHRYWRMYVTQVGNMSQRVMAVGWMGWFANPGDADSLSISSGLTGTGQNILQGATNVYNPTKPGATVNASTYADNGVNTLGGPWSIGVDFGTPKLPVEIGYIGQPHTPELTDRVPVNFRIEWSDDGTHWTESCSVYNWLAGTTLAQNTEYRYTFTNQVNALNTKQVNKSVAATLSETVSSLKGLFRSASATISSTPSIAKGLYRTFTASISSAGTAIKSVGKNFAASISNTPTSAALKVIQRAFSATVASSGNLLRSVGKLATTTIAKTPTILRSIGKNFSTSSTNVVSAARGFYKSFSASIANSPTYSSIKVVARVFSATVSSTPSMIRQIGKSASQTLAKTPTIIRNVVKNFSSSIAITPSIIYGRLLAKNIAATVSSSASQVKSVFKNASATLNKTPTMVRSVARVMSTTVSKTPTALKGLGKTLITSVAKTPTMIRQVWKNATVAKASVGSIQRDLQREFDGGSTLNSSYQRFITKEFDSSILNFAVKILDSSVLELGKVTRVIVTAGAKTVHVTNRIAKKTIKLVTNMTSKINKDV